MKKALSIIVTFIILFLLSISISVKAAELNNIDITTDKTTVHPGETITLSIDFGENLGSYTVDVAYDSNLLDYVSVDGGTADDNGTRVRTSFYDTTGGTNPRNSMSVTFKAVDDITTSNPTDLSITAEGLANADASVTYDDIGTPIIKNIIVEPEYQDYNIALNYTGDIIKEEEKDMKIVISSSMGRSYAHTRIIAETDAPEEATVKLIGIDSESLEHDIIQSGWGSAEGDSLGGENVSKQLDVTGLFSDAGDYTITLKIIDRDNSDSVIASKDFNINVKGEAEITPPQQEPVEQPKPEEPVLPKTGSTVYYIVLPTISALVVAYVVLKKKEEK